MVISSLISLEGSLLIERDQASLQSKSIETLPGFILFVIIYRLVEGDDKLERISEYFETV